VPPAARIVALYGVPTFALGSGELVVNEIAGHDADTVMV